MDKLMHRSVVTTVAGSKKGPDAKFLDSKGVKLEAGTKRLTLEQFKSLIKERPKAILGQNAKMFVSGGEKYNFVDISLPAYQGIIVDESTDKFKIIKTCPSAQECTIFCYASKGNYTMFPAVALKAATVLNYLWNDYDGFVAQIKKELNEAKTGKKKGPKYDLVMRWHDSGDVISEGYLDMMIDIAKETPDVIHYAYTKQLDLIDKKEGIPENLKFTKSFGGKGDAKIDVAKDKSAQVVPAEIFSEFEKDAKTSEKTWRGKKVKVFEFRPEDLKIIKERVAKKFDLPENDIITYDELMKIPYDKENKAKWHVLVFHGHGDDAGMRNDVKTVLLFAH